MFVWPLLYAVKFISSAVNCKCVRNLGSYPGSLNRATGEIVTESEVSRVLRGTDNMQSVLGSWGPSVARVGRPTADITSLTSSCIPPIIIIFLILSLLLRTGGGLSFKRESERETEVKGRNEVSVSLFMYEVTEGRVANGAVTDGVEQHGTRSYHH